MHQEYIGKIKKKACQVKPGWVDSKLCQAKPNNQIQRANWNLGRWRGCRYGT